MRLPGTTGRCDHLSMIVRPTRLAVSALIVMLAFAGCTGLPRVSSAQAEEAFMVAFAGAYLGTMAVQFGYAPAGVAVDDETRTVTFTDFNVSDLETAYESLSGTLTTTNDSASAAFTLAGGPVESISFDIRADQMSSTSIATTATVNGRSMEIQIEQTAQ